MFKHYLKTILKEILNEKFYSIIIIVGFTLGIFSWIMIMLWIDFEEKSFGLKNDSLLLFRISSLEHEASEVWLDSNKVYHYRLFPETPFPLAPAIKRMTPSIVSIARFGYFADKVVSSDKIISFEKRFAYADIDLFKFYKFPLIRGNISDFSKDSNVIIINKATADKYFNGENPLGKILKIDNRYNLKVIAVIKNISSYNKLQFDAIAPISLIKDRTIANNWTDEIVNTYFFVKRKTNTAKIIRNINMIMYDNSPGFRGTYLVDRIPRHHSYSDIRAEAGISGDIQFIYIFAAIAFFLILIASFNYFNISISQFANKSKDISIRKTFGAERKNIIIQYLIESQVLSFLSLAFALILVIVLIPKFNHITSADIKIVFWKNNLLLKCFLITFIIGLVSGSYPAFYFSSVNPARIFSSIIKSGSKGKVFRWVISFIQFTLSVTLIIFSFKVDRQLDYLRNTKVGYDETYTIHIPLSNNIKNKFNFFKKELSLQTNILETKLMVNQNIIDKKDLALHLKPEFISISIKPKYIADNIRSIGYIYNKYEKDIPFEYTFTDSDMMREFRSETIMSEIFKYFTITTTFITLLGFFCISSFIAEQRKTEIAIRKSFGASSYNIYFFIIREFLLINLAAIVTANISVTFIASVWVQRFSYKIGDFGFIEYVIPNLISILLLIATVSYHAIKASKQAPADVLKRL
ncbi:MAG: ABC transporter permease [Bacteroidetes bacterium]|nr:MAG: ABC transporter permease [Bacteroidota bacterium]